MSSDMFRWFCISSEKFKSKMAQWIQKILIQSILTILEKSEMFP